ncbi:MAG: rhomboid family intramembrane serine protease [Flavobacteriales bacterium]
MDINILTIIILVTVGVSWAAFNNQSTMQKMLYIPYDCKHNGNYVRMLSHMLIHADLGHLVFNMFSLYFLGSALLEGVQEYIDTPKTNGLIPSYGDFIGQVHFFVLYFFGGLFATLIPYMRNQDNPKYRSLGASGAVSAVIFAAIIWNPSMQLGLMFIPIPIPAYIFGPLYLLYEFYADKKGNSGIAHDAHIGGAIFGVIYVLVINFEKGQEFIENIF